MKIYLQTLWVAATNSYVITQNQRECVVIDAPPDPVAIISQLATLGLKVVALIATHGHVDHSAGLYDVSRATHPDAIYCNRGDHHMITHPLENSGPLQQALVASRCTIAAPEHLSDLPDGTVIRGAGLTVRALHTPGHTQGSTCLLVGDGTDEVLMSGDHLFAGSIGRTDLPGGSLPMLLASMKEKILPLADTLHVYPGHGPATTIGKERATNPFLTSQED